MPKIVDNYVLERKIGSGQFGEVFKGYNKQSNVDIAVKSVRRELLKGKFHELLENEIKVLRTCNNENIVKLYDIKKTQNNIYLVLEYCNEGDLSNYIKQRKYLTEDEAVEYLLQILNAFKTLVKAKIMHRDFKLANILKHNGSIKIADFGFAKLLGNDSFATTMLGSPLNMAPEILNGTEYDNKADIWSIGTVFYELLFGKSPFVAGNMVDLLKNIKTKHLEVPKKVNNISDVVEDVLRRMLTVDAKDRIEWDELFSHKINSYQEEKLQRELENTLKSADVSLSMSRFYIKNNRVIDHPSEINKKEELNNYAIQVACHNKGDKYQGTLIKRQTEREEEKQSESEGIVKKEEGLLRKEEGVGRKEEGGGRKEEGGGRKEEGGGNVSGRSPEKLAQDQLQLEETLREAQIRINKRNSNRILHERNIYVFLASVAEDCMNHTTIKNNELVGFVLVKKLLCLIQTLQNTLTTRANDFNLENWEAFTLTKDFVDILQYIGKEYEVFRVYFEQLFERICGLVKGSRSWRGEEDVMGVLNLNLKDAGLEKAYRKILMDYLKSLVEGGGGFGVGKKEGGGGKKEVVGGKKEGGDEEARLKWLHVNRILDCMRIVEVFRFEDRAGNQFNFKVYYDETNRFDLETLKRLAEGKMKELKF